MVGRKRLAKNQKVFKKENKEKAKFGYTEVDVYTAEYVAHLKEKYGSNYKTYLDQKDDLFDVDEKIFSEKYLILREKRSINLANTRTKKAKAERQLYENLKELIATTEKDIKELEKIKNESALELTIEEKRVIARHQVRKERLEQRVPCEKCDCVLKNETGYYAHITKIH